MCNSDAWIPTYFEHASASKPRKWIKESEDSEDKRCQKWRRIKDVFPRASQHWRWNQKKATKKSKRDNHKIRASMERKRPGHKQDFDVKQKPIQSRRCANPKPMMEKMCEAKAKRFPETQMLIPQDQWRKGGFWPKKKRLRISEDSIPRISQQPPAPQWSSPPKWPSPPLPPRTEDANRTLFGDNKKIGARRWQKMEMRRGPPAQKKYHRKLTTKSKHVALTLACCLRWTATQNLKIVAVMKSVTMQLPLKQIKSNVVQLRSHERLCKQLGLCTHQICKHLTPKLLSF